MKQTFTVHVAHDTEADVWFVAESDVPGLAAEADTFDALAQKLPAMIEDLLECNADHGGDDGEPCEAPVEIIAHHHARVKVGAVAA